MISSAKTGIDPVILLWFIGGVENPDPFFLPENFRLRFAGIDEQHEELIAIVNDFCLSVKGGKLPDFEMLFKRFLTSLSGHFADEEKIMQDEGYSALERHAGLHRSLLQCAVDLREFCRRRGYANIDTVYDCFDFVIRDIRDEDLSFGAHLESRGLQRP